MTTATNGGVTIDNSRITHKPDRGWTPKAYKEREIPVPDRLIEALKAWKGTAERNCDLLFPTGGCKPNTHFLEALKEIAKRASSKPHALVE